MGYDPANWPKPGESTTAGEPVDVRYVSGKGWVDADGNPVDDATVAESINPGGGSSFAPTFTPPGTALTPEQQQTIEGDLRDWVDSNVPSAVSSRDRNQFVDLWMEALPGAGYTDFINNADFTRAVKFLPAAELGLPPFFIDENGQVVEYSLRTGFTYPNSADVKYLQQSPTIPHIDLGAAFGSIRPATSGGGGGGGRTNRVFDTRQLEEAANNMHKGWLLADGADAVVGWVKEYQKQANAFWVTQGGNLDFETFIKDKLRATDRYAILYEKKPKEFTEEQFLNQYVQGVSQGGGGLLRPSRQTREIERSLTSGGSAAGQARRVAQSEDVMRANPSNFAAAFANTVRGLGRAALR